VWKKNSFNKKIDFLRSTNCKLLSQVKENSTSDCDIFFMFIIPVTAAPSAKKPNYATGRVE
jgi:hypothetical protein